MEWVSIYQVVTSIAMVSLATATVWMGWQTKKSVGQTKEMYDKDNTPLLEFDFNFQADNSQLIARQTEDNHAWMTSINGTLVNVSDTAAVSCEFAILRIENEKTVNCFEKNIKIASGLAPRESIKFKREIFKKDYLDSSNTDANRHVEVLLSCLDCKKTSDEFCPFRLVFYYKNRFGKQYCSEYKITTQPNGTQRRVMFNGSRIVN